MKHGVLAAPSGTRRAGCADVRPAAPVRWRRAAVCGAGALLALVARSRSWALRRAARGDRLLLLRHRLARESPPGRRCSRRTGTRSRSCARRFRARASLSPADTVVLLEPDALLHSEGARLMAFVRRRRAAAVRQQRTRGHAPRAAVLAAAVVRAAPARFAGARRGCGTAAPTVGGCRGGEVRTAGAGQWLQLQPATARRCRASGGGALLLERATGEGDARAARQTSRRCRTGCSARPTTPAWPSTSRAPARGRSCSWSRSTATARAAGWRRCPRAGSSRSAGLALAGVLWVLARADGGWARPRARRRARPRRAAPTPTRSRALLAAHPTTSRAVIEHTRPLGGAAG